MPKTVLITGGARGIGRVTAMRLLADGYNVAFTYARSKAAAEEFVSTDRARLHAYAGDVRDDARNREIVDNVVARFGALDALVNNAGIRRDALMFNMTGEQWDDVVATNLRGAYSMIHAALPAMMKQRRGSIVSVASVSGLQGVVGQANYSAAKGGLIAMTRSIAREVARSGVRVNCIAPGLVETAFARALYEDPERRAKREAETPLRRLGQPEDIAGAALLLASKAGAFITGQTIVVDGGVMIA